MTRLRPVVVICINMKSIGKLSKKTTSDKLTPMQKEELEALADLPDEQINTQDTPELSDWSEKKRSLFFRPVK